MLGSITGTHYELHDGLQYRTKQILFILGLLNVQEVLSDPIENLFLSKHKSDLRIIFIVCTR